MWLVRIVVSNLVYTSYSFSVSDVSSYLTILRSKGLVQTICSRRGVVGGSSWELTEVCRKLLGTKYGTQSWGEEGIEN